MPELSWNRYGKLGIRLVKVRRTPAGPATAGSHAADVPHELVDLTIDVQLEGDFGAVYVDGDNTPCLATDTMKNTVYAMARQDPINHVETFAARLADHFLAKPAVSRVRISAVEQPWGRLSSGGRPHPHAFVQAGGEHWTAVVTRDTSGVHIVSGLANLIVLKTSDSAFAGFPRDEYTTLPGTSDRLMATSITASWTYRQDTSDFSVRAAVRRALVETFAGHVSRSVQHTLYAMGEAALSACPDVVAITLSLPNRHHLLVDLKPFGLDNPNEIFVATDRPFGLIEATITRTSD
jgi:urate oxidase